MIEQSEFVIFYFDETYLPGKSRERAVELPPSSGTALAYNFALKKKKKITNLHDTPLDK